MAINDSCGDVPPIYSEDNTKEPFQWRKKGKKRTYKHFAKKNKCIKKIRTFDGRDTFVWQLCVALRTQQNAMVDTPSLDRTKFKDGKLVGKIEILFEREMWL